MQIGAKTKISVLLGQFPFLKDFLKTLSPHFKTLDSALARNTVGRFATLSQAAMMGGIELNTLIAKIAEEIKKTGNEVSVIDESTKGREDILKGIILDLHKGVDINILKMRFLELVKDVSPYEIAQMEQKLIAEGMPETEVKRLCSIHVEVFKEALDHKTVPGLASGHPVHTFMLENRSLEALIRQAEEADDKNLPQIIEEISKVEIHYQRKENQLFPMLESKGFSGPSKVMWAVHDDIRMIMKELMAKPAKGKTFDFLMTALKDMIYKEEHILFPMALEAVSDADWAKVKKGEEEIGFAWLKSVDVWKPRGSEQEPQAEERIGGVNLDTGVLTIEQINLMLTHLPVDVSFVNEDDEVLYYSQTKERIFPRSPGVIGRKVQNCHPPKSVDTVQKILDSFKNGEKDSAEFWIQMKGRFLHIRYFAVRDSKGKYKGCLEVSQDVTEIRSLEGQKRLLDW